MSEPRISVVIPTMGRRSQRLAAGLEGLASQDFADGELEVLVAADPGVEVPAGPPGLELRVVRAPAPASAAAKRNLAWRQARAPLVAFTDDDCRPAPEWAAALVAAAERAPGAFVQGRTIPHPSELPDLWGFAHTQGIERDSPWHETCNIAYPRSLLEALRGFDESYGALGGEDTDLGERARTAGAPKAYEPGALVWHAVEQRSFRQALREAARTRDQPQVLARYPEKREELLLGLFYRAEHAALPLALAGMASRRPAVRAATQVPYIYLHLQRYRLSPRSVARAGAHLPVRMAVSAIETAVVAGRALRNGVIAL